MARICDLCQRDMPKATAVQDGIAACNSCYQREFKRVECEDCGQPTRSLHGRAPKKCRSCGAKNRICLRCDKPIKGKAGKRIGNGSVCGPCSKYYRDAKECARCGQMSLLVGTSPSNGIHEAICRRCLSKATLIQCEGCGHPRKPYRLNKNGVPVCKPCYEKGPFTCPKCKTQDAVRYSDKECRSCADVRRMRARVNDAQAILKADYVQHAIADYGAHLLTSSAINRPFYRFDRDVTFFVRLDVAFPNVGKADAFGLASTFGLEMMRRYTIAVGFLNKAGHLPYYDETEVSDAGERAKQDRVLAKHSDRWYHGLMVKFRAELEEDHHRRVSRNNASSTRSITSALRAGEKLLMFAESEGVTSQTGMSTSVVEKFLDANRGYQFALRRFIAFLKMRAKRFEGTPMDVPLPQAGSLAHGVPIGKQRTLYQGWIRSDGDEARRSLIGVFMLIYGQRARQICRIKMSQVERVADDFYMVRFAKQRLPVDGPDAALLTRYLEHRKAQSHLDSAEDNPFLFPGKRYGAHLSESTVTGYLKDWGVTAEEMLAAAIIKTIESGENNPALLRDGFGICNDTAMKYLEQYGDLQITV